MTIILFEDEQIAQLYPVTISRPAFAVTCGGFRLVDLIETLGHPAGSLVRPHLRGIVREDFGLPELASPEISRMLDDNSTLLVNGRMVPSAANLKQLAALVAENRPCLVRHGERLSAALLPPNAELAGLAVDTVTAVLLGLGLDEIKVDLPLIDYPHDIIRHHVKSLSESLEFRLSRGSYQQHSDGLFVAEGAHLGEFVATDTSGGPIVLDQNASVGPHSFLKGPIHLGAGCRVIEHSAIKDFVSLGHTTKIGGEVEASIIEPYTNKQHHGFLGHSYLGSWINLGAGTCNSDLKNTYGMVKMEIGHKRIDTGMQFIGCIVGDYSKTAVNTSIFTGKTVGVCSMLYGFVTTNVPSFVNYARSFGQVTETPPEVLVSTQARMFARRNVPQRPCDIELLHAMYELTQHERQLAGEPLAL